MRGVYSGVQAPFTYTLEEFVMAGKDSKDVSYYNFSILQVNRYDNDVEIHFSVDNIINDYLDVLRDYSKTVEMDDNECNKYFYNPDLLAFDIYGSTELGFVIMKINGIADPKDFDMKKIKLVNRSALQELLSAIYIAETNYITSNRLNYDLKI